MIIDERDSSNRNPQRRGYDAGQAVEGLLGGRIEDVVSTQGLQTELLNSSLGNMTPPARIAFQRMVALTD